MSGIIPKSEILKSTKQSPEFKEMVDEINELLLKTKGYSITYIIKHYDLTGILIDELEDKGYDVFLSNGTLLVCVR